MKKYMILIFAIYIFLALNATNIQSIDSITFDKTIIDFDYYSSSIKQYNNKLIIQNEYKIEEYEIVSPDSISRVSFIETGRFVNTPAFIDGDKYYCFFKKNDVYMMIIDLSVSPIEIVSIINLPVNSYVRFYTILTDEHILITDYDNSQALKFNKSTYEFDGSVNGLSGVTVADQNCFVNVYYVYDNAEMTDVALFFYYLSETDDFQQTEPYAQLLLGGPFEYINNMKIEDNILYYFSVNNIVLVDLNDYHNPEILMHINTENLHNQEVLYSDAILHNNLLITCTSNAKFIIYDISDLDNISILHQDFYGFITYSQNLLLNYPYLYANLSNNLQIIDLENNFSTVKTYGLNRLVVKIKNDFVSYLDKNSRKIVFKSFLDSEIEYSIDNRDTFILDFYVGEDKIFIIYSYLNMLYLDIFEINQGDCSLILTQEIDYPVGIYERNNFIYNTGRFQTTVYTFNENELSFYTSIPGRFQSPSGYDSDDYVVFSLSNEISFRDINNPLIELGSFYNQNINNSSRLFYINEENIVVRNNIFYWTFFSFDSVDFSLSNFYNFYNESHTNVFNNIFSVNGDDTFISEYFYVNNSQLIPIGEKQGLRYVQSTFFFPEYNKMVQFCMSGIHLYDIEYTVSESDQVVEYKRESFVYPNPVNGEEVNFKTTLNTTQMEISIYNVKGQLVKRSKDFQSKDGDMTFSWNKKNEQNQTVASGVYFYKIKTDKAVQTGKFLIIK